MGSVVMSGGWRMQKRHPLSTVAVLALVVSLPLLGLSTVASAKGKKAHGCHKTHSCQSGGGTGTGSGTGAATPPPLTVQVDPNPLVETTQSLVLGVIQVETSPSFAGDPVVISSAQLEAACGGLVSFDDLQGPVLPGFQSFKNNITVILDDDGNATVDVFAEFCAPGTSVVEASLAVAPYYTGLATLVTLPPQVTTPGVVGYPSTSGTVTTGEVETGDSATSGNSDVIAVFYVETSPVYAEQEAEIGSDELESRCGDGYVWFAGDSTGQFAPTVSFPLDDDGNAVFEFVGASCAAGPSTVIADVLAGTHTTYTTTFTVVAPEPTI
jgi:hypothetical protein